jgi:uncharacterized membrane protein
MIIEFIGRFHPLLVHLPIGILLLAVLFEWLSRKEKFKSLQASILPILLIGSVSALLSCVTGFLLSQSGEYESDLVGWHQWMGINLTIISSVYTWIKFKKKFTSLHKIISFTVLICLMVTGHLGGSLTHGEDYLTEGFSLSSDYDFSKVDLQQAFFYKDMVQPVLQNKCYGCHGPSKQKGKLRLDMPEHILKGGKDGAVIVAGKADESDLVYRIHLPMDDDDHMPPKEKKQLTQQEINLLDLWISSGADFEKPLQETGQLAAVEKIISEQKTEIVLDVPTGDVPAADPSINNQLQKLGVVILPVDANSNYLSANLINVTSLDSVIDLLILVKAQLVWLKAGGQPVTNMHLSKLATLSNLTRLSLENTQVTEEGLSDLKSLTNLQYLNLRGNKITSAGLAQLENLKALKSLNVYQTLIKPEEIESLRKSFPYIEAGGYIVPTLPDDTVIMKVPR